eukprot:CAMPEP_0198537838 /NCGR_PEP_ID=MMETSP1462-20131121/45358_1 /TAXON_ID=1333877 /ORGANISM="Brandtodinium nutriculum, Strain RCC3387" /LENGTH=77 /DNA_ID=CAMNT_0044267843 /DNA_START=36 /DNA_END=266 /DNA_ORIENTATION=+
MTEPWKKRHVVKHGHWNSLHAQSLQHLRGELAAASSAGQACPRGARGGEHADPRRAAPMMVQARSGPRQCEARRALG